MKKRKILKISQFFMVLCFAVLAGSNVSAIIGGYITGVVRDAYTDEPIQTAVIRTSEGRSALSNINGTYRITHESGKYTLIAEAEGYMKYSAIVEVRESENVVRNINMIPIPKYTLTVSKTGNGTITDNTSGIHCGADCDEEYPDGTSVTLTALPDHGWIFGGWSGTCTGNGPCELSMDSNKEVSAIFQEVTLPDAYEEDDSFLKASTIDKTQHHNFHDAGDEDWMMFYATAGEAYTVKSANQETECDVVIELYDTDGTRMLKSVNEGKHGEDEIMEWNCRQDGIYYVKTQNYDPDSFGDDTGYDLSCSNSKEYDAYEEDDNIKQAQVIVLNDKLQHHNFHDTGDEDWVMFYGVEKKIYTIKTTDLESRCDTVIELYDSNVKLLKKKDIEGDGTGENMDLEFPPNGIYYVRVKNADPNVYGKSTDYNLLIFHPESNVLQLVSGLISDSETGEPIKMATVITSEGMSAITINNGTYSMRHKAGTYTLTAEAEGYEKYSAEVQIRETGTTKADIEMIPISSYDPGDIDNSGTLDLHDIILALKILTEASSAGAFYYKADADGDKKISMAEAVYILQRVSKLRE